MSRRSYRQHCGLAAALDLVSQRWALLIVRDLAPGPRRFSDLFAGLPGISTDMLTDRLRELEEADVVERVVLAAPAPATVYRLTDRGRELSSIGGQLATWGAPLLPPVESSPLRPNARWALQSFAARYRGDLPDGSFGFRFDDREDVSLSLSAGTATVSYGPPADGALATLTCSSGRSSPARSRRPATSRVTGSAWPRSWPRSAACSGGHRQAEGRGYEGAGLTVRSSSVSIMSRTAKLVSRSPVRR